MPGPTPWAQQYFTINSTTQTLVTTSETVVATLVGVNSRSAGVPVTLNGFAFVTLGTNGTAITVRIRAISLTGTLIGVALVTGAAQVVNPVAYPIEAQDTPTGEYAGQTYVLTVQQAGATANGSVALAALGAVV